MITHMSSDVCVLQGAWIQLGHFDSKAALLCVRTVVVG